MGRLIDETDLMNLLYALDDARHELFYAIKKIPELPTVQAIPKADYENRLKDDMVAMLEVIKLRIDSLPEPLNRDRVNYCIQEKINALKAESEK